MSNFLPNIESGRWAPRGLLVSVTILALFQAANGPRAVAGDEPAGLKKGWRWRSTIPAVKAGDLIFSRESRVTTWEEEGWLHVRRTTVQGDLEWQVVLARASDQERPQIEVDKDTGGMAVSYRGYFVREGMLGKLRVYRERKTDQAANWPAPELEGERRSLGSGGGATAYLDSFALDQWCWVQSGISEGRPDLWVRLQPVTKRAGKASRGNAINGIETTRGGPVEMFYGDSQAQDEGDLFIGTRVTFDTAEEGLEGLLLHDALGTKDTPELAGEKWFNTDDELLLRKLEGKVVLLYFWANWCDASTKRLLRVEEINRKFGDRDLVVIGIHSAEQSGDAGKFLKDNKVSFPVMIDNGQTARRYRVGALPTFFLIDKSNKPAWGYSIAPPPDALLEELFK